MGLVTATLSLGNPRDASIAPIEVPALADGSCISVPHVGPVVVRFKNRIGVVGALLLGDEVLLGATPLENMDLVVNPRARTVDIDPASPNIACGIVKRAA